MVSVVIRMKFNWFCDYAYQVGLSFDVCDDALLHSLLPFSPIIFFCFF